VARLKLILTKLYDPESAQSSGMGTAKTVFNRNHFLSSKQPQKARSASIASSLSPTKVLKFCMRFVLLSNFAFLSFPSHLISLGGARSPHNILFMILLRGFSHSPRLWP
jgi:hypothetical protein